MQPKMLFGGSSAGTSFATGLPFFVMTTGVRYFLTSSITRKHFALNSPAGMDGFGRLTEARRPSRRFSMPVGLATALHFARQGYEVFAGARDVAGATDLAAAIERERLSARPLALDVNDDA